jgi:hypothetical protein
MRIHLRSIRTLAAFAATAAALACGSSTEPRATEIRPSNDLNIVTRVSAPALVSNSVSFWAKKGQNREAVLVYANSSSGGGGAEFMHLKIDAKSLDRAPNGTAYADGDSVLITATAVPGKVEVDFQPSGLRFSAANPAELRLRFAEADADINHDGRQDATDDALRLTLALWAQETANAPWTKLVTDLRIDTGDANAKLLGFTTYALAY